MKLFVTGGTGFIGSVVVDELIQHGHQVVGLARSDKSASRLEKAGAEVIRGDLENLEALKRGSKESDGVIHLGFIHDFANYSHCCKIDGIAIDAIISELKGTNKPFVGAADFAGVVNGTGKIIYETDKPVVDTNSDDSLRTANEIKILESHKKEIRSIVIRLPPTVHGANDHGAGDQAFIPELIKISKEKKVSYFIGDGKNIWSAIHRNDAAVLFRLATEKGLAGRAYHAVHENIETKKIAEAIGKLINVPVKSGESSMVTKELGFVGGVFAMDVNASVEITKKDLGPWEPKESGLLEDIEKNYAL